jgi:predicted RNase H-like HicB family nuclease
MKYRIALDGSEEGICVGVPGLPGCVSQRDTEEEALADIAEAIREHLEVTMEQAAGAEWSSVSSKLRGMTPPGTRAVTS